MNLAFAWSPAPTRPRAPPPRTVQPDGTASRAVARPSRVRSGAVTANRHGERLPGKHPEAVGVDRHPAAERQAAPGGEQRPVEGRMLGGGCASAPLRQRRPRLDEGQVVAAQGVRVGRHVGEAGPALGGVLALRLPLDLRPAAPVRRRCPRPHAVDGLARVGRHELRRTPGPGGRGAVGGAHQHPVGRERLQPFLGDLLPEAVGVTRGLVGLDGDPGRLLVVAVLARRGRRVHRDEHLGPGLAQDAHGLAQGLLVVPHLGGEGLGDGVVEVDLVEVVDVGDPRLRDRVALLALADQPQGRPLLRSDGVARRPPPA